MSTVPEGALVDHLLQPTFGGRGVNRILASVARSTTGGVDPFPLGVLVGSVLIVPIAQDSSSSLSVKVVSSAYPLADVLMLAVLVNPVLAAVGEDRQRPGARVHRDGHAHPGVGARELLEHQDR